ncbi:MAG TPA: hypothetical protein VG847_06400, partial [Chitinophagaceae bacterium]|nr:hypothetical protein [Chitinophagaceae bacterium]
MKFVYSFCFVLFAAVSVQAQLADSTAANSVVVKKKTQISVACTYNTGLNYYGRTDSLKSRGFYPTVGINFKNGLYLNSTFIFISNKAVTAYAASIVEGGFQFSDSANRWSGNIFANGFFYRQRDLVQSALKGSAGINVTRLSKFLDYNLTADGKLSNDIDFGASFGLDHIIRINKAGKGVIVLDPSAYIYAGTQNFSRSYLQQKSVWFLPAGDELINENSKKFNILSYEFSVPMIYAIGKIKIALAPA